jgi:large subunit ribosomal protein L17
MRHRLAGRKLGRITPHRIALLRNLATALFQRERIRTTLMKAKELRPFAERLITLAKRDGDRVHARRLVRQDIHESEIAQKLFEKLAPRFSDRAGGYTRILRLGSRQSDGAEMAIVELIGSEYKPKTKEEKDKKKGATPTDKGEPKAKAKGEPKASKKTAAKAAEE